MIIWICNLLVRFMRWRQWNYGENSNGIRRRLYCLFNDHNPWWDWGHRLMILVGRDFGGNWSEPEPPTWYYRRGSAKKMWKTGFPTHPFRTFEIIKNYSDFTDRTKDLNEDQLYEWSAINGSQDGDLQFGHMYWGQGFYGLAKDEQAILRRYMRMWRRLNWYGLRSYLYSQGLHAAVNRKKPFSCKMTPPKNSGGYSHWHCNLRKRHKGPHKYNNYVWDESKDKVEFVYTNK